MPVHIIFAHHDPLLGSPAGLGRLVTWEMDSLKSGLTKMSNQEERTDRQTAMKETLVCKEGNKQTKRNFNLSAKFYKNRNDTFLLIQ